MQEKPLLKELVDQRELAFVAILRSYLQLNFDGPYLNVYTMPEVGEVDLTIKPAEPGYYDNLCGLVGEKVISTKEFADVCLILTFERDAFLRISLKPADRQGAEAVMLQDGKGERWMVW